MWNPRTWPWWTWILVILAMLVALVVSLGLVLRNQGMHELRITIDELHARGFNVLPRDLLARAPAVDPLRQARAWALFGNGGSWTSRTQPIYGPGAVASGDAEAKRILADSAAARSEWRSLYQAGPVVLSLYGWVAAHTPDPDHAGIATLAASPIPSMLNLRNMAEALATEARRADDPRAALADLDALVAAGQPSGSMIDAFTCLAVAGIRDDAWLEAAARGVIDPKPWIDARSADELAMVADGIAAERMLFGGGFVQDIHNGTLDSFAYASFGGGLMERLAWYTTTLPVPIAAPHDVAFYLREVTKGEVLARTGHGDVSNLGPRLRAERWRLPISAIALPDTGEAVISGAERAFQARVSRCAAGIAWDFAHGVALPADAAHLPAAVAALVPATAFAPTLRYTRLSATRFRLDCDPATPPTDLLPTGRIEAWKPIKERFKQTKWGLEWDLAPQP